MAKWLDRFSTCFRGCPWLVPRSDGELSRDCRPKLLRVGVHGLLASTCSALLPSRECLHCVDFARFVRSYCHVLMFSGTNVKTLDISYYYYYNCHGLQCCHHTVAGALYKI